MDRGAWWAAVHRVAKSRTRLKRLSTHTHSSELGKLFEMIAVWLFLTFKTGSFIWFMLDRTSF